jgi:hypothetical protein
MKLKAKDTLHISSVKADNLVKGEEFEVSDAEGKQLIERGLAVKVSAPRAAAKKAAAPSNKKAPIAANKLAPAAKNKNA